MTEGDRKVQLREIEDTMPSARWFWVVLQWSANGKLQTGDGTIVPGSENGFWFNAACCHRSTFMEAAQQAEIAYNRLST